MHFPTLFHTPVFAALCSFQPAVAVAMPRALAQKMCLTQAFGAILCSDHSGSFDNLHPPWQAQHNDLPFPFSLSFLRSFLVL